MKRRPPEEAEPPADLPQNPPSSTRWVGPISNPGGPRPLPIRRRHNDGDDAWVTTCWCHTLLGTTNNKPTATLTHFVVGGLQATSHGVTPFGKKEGIQSSGVCRWDVLVFVFCRSHKQRHVCTTQFQDTTHAVAGGATFCVAQSLFYVGVVWTGGEETKPQASGCSAGPDPPPAPRLVRWLWL